MPSAPIVRDRRLHFFRPACGASSPQRGPRALTLTRFSREMAAIGRTDSMKRTTKKPQKTLAREPDLVPEDKPRVSQPADQPAEASSRLHEEEPAAEHPALDED